MLDRLVDAGNTVVVIEHNLDVIKTADRIIDLGPEGGEEGGQIVAHGTPEQVAAAEGSYTGRFLAEIVEPAKQRPRRRHEGRRPSWPIGPRHPRTPRSRYHLVATLAGASRRGDAAAAGRHARAG